jgi:hypothetical protein
LISHWLDVGQQLNAKVRGEGDRDSLGCEQRNANDPEEVADIFAWRGLEKDLPPGEELVACFRPFLGHLASSTLSPKAIRRHVDNLWLLGGEIIRDLNRDPSLRKVAAQQLIRNVVGVDGGPLIYNGSEEEQRSLDSTCRKLHRFLSQPQR